MAPSVSLRRRAVLAGAAGTVAATSGCIGELQNIVGRQRTQQLSLTIATLPADDDPYAIGIANALADHLEASGVTTVVDPMAPDALLREVLINKDFDIYVARYPSDGAPEVLWELLHSRYTEEAGWQNPFGFSSPTVDDLLEAHRSADDGERRDLLDELQEAVVREQPFTVVAFPDVITGHRTDRFSGWENGIRDSISYLSLEGIDDAETLRVAVRDPRLTRNLNPIAAEYRNKGITTGLIYDPLARAVDGELIPWLARRIEWDTSGELSATIDLRSAVWHDGEPITPDDVVFTYRFLQDTSLGEFDSPVPTPFRRGASSLIESVHVEGESRVVLTFASTSETLARRALTVPVLPEHEWEDRTEAADIAGIDIVGATTEALVWPNLEPVGSGPFTFADATEAEELVLERFDDHFLLDGDFGGVPEPYASGLSFESLVFLVVPSWDAATQLLLTGEADALAGNVSSAVVPRLARSNEASVVVNRSNAFYHVGYNCRRDPLTNFRFRQVLARLLDRSQLVAETFDNYATAGESPLEGTDWIAESLEWDGEGELSFLGEEGELDVEQTREEFSEAGFQYEDGQLIRRGDT